MGVVAGGAADARVCAGHGDPDDGAGAGPRHPDDRDYVAATLAEVRRNRRAFSTRHRIVDVHEAIHEVIVIGNELYDDQAFGLLKWRSQETNTKVRRLAQQVCADFLALSYEDELPSRSDYDQLLLTTHRRIHDTDEKDGVTLH